MHNSIGPLTTAFTRPQSDFLLKWRKMKNSRHSTQYQTFVELPMTLRWPKIPTKDFHGKCEIKWISFTLTEDEQQMKPTKNNAHKQIRLILTDGPDGPTTIRVKAKEKKKANGGDKTNRSIVTISNYCLI